MSDRSSRSSTPRARLRDELSTRLVPALRARGFTGPTRITGNATWYEFSRAGPHGQQRIDLRLDKYARPRFTLDLHSVPPAGATWEMVGNLQPQRAAWFRADRPWWQRLVGIRSTLEEETVSQAIALLDEVDAWFEKLPRLASMGAGKPYGTQRLSEHVLTYKVPVASNPL